MNTTVLIRNQNSNIHRLLLLGPAALIMSRECEYNVCPDMRSRIRKSGLFRGKIRPQKKSHW